MDDSDGTVGDFITEAVDVLQEYAEMDDLCINAFKDLCGAKTCFGWEEPLVSMIDEDLRD